MVTQRLRRSGMVGAMVLWAWMIGISPQQAFALPTASVAAVQTASAREAQIDKVVSALSTPQARMQLRIAGISPARLQEGLSRLDDAQLVQVAQKAETIKAGGQIGFVIAVLIVAILIVILVELVD